MTWYESFANHFHQNFIHQDRYMLLLNGLWLTIQVSFFGILLGIVLGTIITVMKMAKCSFFGKLFGLHFLDKIINGMLNGISYIYIDVIRGTPVVTQLFIFWFVIFAPHTNLPRIMVAIIAIGVNSGAYVAEIMRAGIMSIDKGQVEAGRTLGLSSFTTMRYIVMPQAIKNILPTLVNEFIVLIKETAIVGFIAVSDLTRAADLIRSRTFNAWMPLIAAAMMYYILIKILTIFLRRLEKRIRQSDVR
jgi:polar amino acid transport system permease protein/polar amino acid transport system substrate-binding protein